MPFRYTHYDDEWMTATRTALVTGASRGIGKACALALAKSGCRVAVAARSLENLQDTESQVRNAGGEAFPWPLT